MADLRLLKDSVDRKSSFINFYQNLNVKSFNSPHTEIMAVATRGVLEDYDHLIGYLATSN